MFEPLREIIIEEPRNYHTLLFDYPKTNLQELYNQGWWITEIFGSFAFLVKLSKAKRTTKKPYFICVQSQLNADQITPEAQKIINQVKNKQWNKYKKYLLGLENERKIQKTTHILLETPRKNTQKTCGISKRPRIS